MRKKINIFITNNKLADYIWANNEVSVRKLGIGSENIETIFRDFPGSPVVKTLRFPLQRVWVWFLAVELGFRLLLKKIKKGFYTSFWLSNCSVSDPYWKQLASPRRWGILERPGLTRQDCIWGMGWQSVSSQRVLFVTCCLQHLVWWGHPDAPRRAASCSPRSRMILLVNLLGLLTRRQRHDLGTYFSQVDLHH